MVIPIYNEVESIPRLYQTLSRVLAAQDCLYEIVFVDDGSTDGSFKALVTLHQADPHVRVIQFRRNFGKTAALVAGFDHLPRRGDHHHGCRLAG